eukprot:CAMPEP_0194222286 /NCGR_PEP_ID=MMETSP0156-20130528/32555_1 /TAXON_ID=33649 /ORGANISM="Thalassionema nitzschioides, Strain L26-B" /LENGTH=572 /DNA_ID=CAMNT_0038953009 /DNA_START=33 /DNA_END=1751 /DNA_ORIENTATION=+
MYLKRAIVENPLWLCLPQQHASRCMLRQNATSPNILERWNTNFSRLYARRMLELLAGSAAFYSLNQKDKTSADALLAEARNIAKPSDWLRYHENQKDWTKEMMDSLGTSSVGRWTMAFSRLINLGLLASPLLIMAPLSFIPTPTLFSSPNKEEAIRRSNSKFHDLMWDYMLFAIEAAGPTFIKFIQWATTRQDLFSQEFCSHFGQLHDSTRGHSWKFTNELLEKELGKDWKSLVQIESEPVGSGCIAQVYKGVLQASTPTMPKGSTVAVKVQHPNIWDKVCVDFFILQHIANTFESIPFLNLDYLSVRDTVDQFAQAMLPQLDLVLEGKHLQRFSRNFADNPQVEFPIPIEELTTPKILVESFCEGTPILKYGKDKDEKTKEEIAMLGLKTTLTMIFLHDFVHGDLHPGNILVRRHPETGQLLMTMIDCGLVIEFGPEQHETVVKILGAFIRRQGRDAGQLMVDTTKVKTNNPVDIERFIKGIERIIVEDAEQGNFVEHIGDYITDICYLACRNRVKLEAAFINCALSMEIMEGIASTLYPNIEVVSTAMPLVMKAEMMHRLPFSWSKYRTS